MYTYFPPCTFIFTSCPCQDCFLWGGIRYPWYQQSRCEIWLQWNTNRKETIPETYLTNHHGMKENSYGYISMCWSHSNSLTIGACQFIIRLPHCPFPPPPPPQPFSSRRNNTGFPWKPYKTRVIFVQYRYTYDTFWWLTLSWVWNGKLKF